MEWTHILPSGLPLWELEFRWTLEFLEGNCRGSKLIKLKTSLHHWKDFEMYMSKMGSHDPFGNLKHKLWPKERTWIIWFPTTKSHELPLFPYVQMACHISLESSWQRLQRFFAPHLNGRFSHNVMGLQNCRSPHFENFGTPKLRVLGQNDIWVQGPWLGTDNTIREKVVASTKFGLCWILWICVCPWLIHALEVLQLCINQLVVWFVQVYVNNWPTYHSS
jgi:hypothetical protein